MPSATTDAPQLSAPPVRATASEHEGTARAFWRVLTRFDSSKVSPYLAMRNSERRRTRSGTAGRAHGPHQPGSIGRPDGRGTRNDGGANKPRECPAGKFAPFCACDDGP